MRSSLVTVKTFGHVVEAKLAQGALAAVGVAAFVADELSSTLVPHDLGALGGVRLQVHRRDARRALAALARLEAAHEVGEDAEDAEDAEACGEAGDPAEAPPACPSCGSLYVYYGLPTRSLFVALFFLGIPLLWLRPRDYCKRCGHEWTRAERGVPPDGLGPYRRPRRASRLAGAGRGAPPAPPAA